MSVSAAIVAIPAFNEADRIGPCLAALGMQRDAAGCPWHPGAFDVLVFANNCSDDTADVARSYADKVPYRLRVIEDRLPPETAHAGGARKIAMDSAAGILIAGRRHDGVILTTDADSRVQPLWITANLAALADGADAVAGYVDADAMEMIALGAGFLRRGRLEDRFLSHVAEIYAILDPRSHDPWPNHRVHSGASFALTLEAYQAIGGLPCRALGEDAALAHALERAGFLIRHSMAASVVTSCRFDSRAPGGAGDTMRLRHANLDADCDDDLEPVDRLSGVPGSKGGYGASTIAADSPKLRPGGIGWGSIVTWRRAWRAFVGTSRLRTCGTPSKRIARCCDGVARCARRISCGRPRGPNACCSACIVSDRSGQQSSRYSGSRRVAFARNRGAIAVMKPSAASSPPSG